MRIDNIVTKDDVRNQFPTPHHNRHEFTEEEIEDIMRFADAFDIQGAARTKLFTYIRDRRAAKAVQKHKVVSSVANS